MREPPARSLPSCRGAFASFSLPPCGGGSGWGVASCNGIPPTLTLPRKGGGNDFSLPEVPLASGFVPADRLLQALAQVGPRPETEHAFRLAGIDQAYGDHRRFVGI